MFIYIILSVSQGRSLTRSLVRFAFSHSSSKRFVCHLVSCARNCDVSAALIFNWSCRFKLNDSQCDVVASCEREISYGNNHTSMFPFWLLDPLIGKKFKQIKIWHTHAHSRTQAIWYESLGCNVFFPFRFINFKRRNPSMPITIWTYVRWIASILPKLSWKY